MDALKLLITIIVVFAVGSVVYYSFMRVPSPDAPAATIVSTAMRLSSPSFMHEGTVPTEYTCDVDTPPSPPLMFENVPAGTVSLALIMDDPDVPTAVRPEGVFDHWVLYDIPPHIPGLPEGGSAGVTGANGRGGLSYAGPCPPPEYEPSEHRYFFRLYALDTKLGLAEGATKDEVIAAMTGHILETAELMARYERTGNQR